MPRDGAIIFGDLGHQARIKKGGSPPMLISVTIREDELLRRFGIRVKDTKDGQRWDRDTGKGA